MPSLAPSPLLADLADGVGVRMGCGPDARSLAIDRKVVVEPACCRGGSSVAWYLGIGVNRDLGA
jgi:hypothetical protein